MVSTYVGQVAVEIIAVVAAQFTRSASRIRADESPAEAWRHTNSGRSPAASAVRCSEAGGINAADCEASARPAQPVFVEALDLDAQVRGYSMIHTAFSPVSWASFMIWFRAARGMQR